MRIFLRLLCLLRGHTPKYYLKRSYRRGGEVWGVKCSTCGQDLETDWRGRFW